jgi:hypothetical protein
MNAETILTNLKTQLQNSSSLSYVTDGNIFLGRRESMTIYPAIIIVPFEEPESDHAYPMERITLSLGIIGLLKVQNPDKHIIGDATTKGIMDFKKDILKALDGDRTLSGSAIHMMIRNKVYDTIENFPMIGVTINVDILFEQLQGTR